MPLVRLTEKKLAANRANAQRSTGPRTPEGKTRSAQNSRVHGLYARKFILSPQQEQTLRAQAAADAHSPGDPPISARQRYLREQTIFYARWTHSLELFAESRIQAYAAQYGIGWRAACALWLRDPLFRRWFRLQLRLDRPYNKFHRLMIREEENAIRRRSNPQFLETTYYQPEPLTLAAGAGATTSSAAATQEKCGPISRSNPQLHETTPPHPGPPAPGTPLVIAWSPAPATRTPAPWHGPPAPLPLVRSRSA